MTRDVASKSGPARPRRAYRLIPSLVIGRSRGSAIAATPAARFALDTDTGFR